MTDATPLDRLRALCLALPVVAGASIPGNIEQRTRESLLHVCTDTEPDDVDDYIVCSEQVGGDPQEEYTGSECVTAGLPAHSSTILATSGLSGVLGVKFAAG